MKQNKKIPVIFYLFISILLLILLSNVAKYSYFYLQNKNNVKSNEIVALYEQINELDNSISKLLRDERIIEFAREKLNMKFPDSQDIICVQRTKISHNDYKYTFQNFISPEVLASDK